ncbi:MAG: hypothetical protein FWF52_00930 [Candidatus Azobacteroides sp.]|nr:hypothetical protein [Candidatus Azobacteroides sp.]
MKKVLYYILACLVCFIMLAAVFTGAGAFFSKDSKVKNSEVNYDKYVNYGDIRLNLPKIAGMTECYSIPIVKKEADEVCRKSDTRALAAYLPNPIYEKINVFLDGIPCDIDGYIFVYVDEKVKNIEWGIQDLNEVSQTWIRNAFSTIGLNLDDVTVEDKTMNDKSASTGKTLLLESYSPDNNAESFVVLRSLQAGSKEYTG